jgi:hypothetical protein
MRRYLPHEDSHIPLLDELSEDEKAVIKIFLLRGEEDFVKSSLL